MWCWDGTYVKISAIKPSMFSAVQLVVAVVPLVVMYLLFLAMMVVLSAQVKAVQLVPR